MNIFIRILLYFFFSAGFILLPRSSYAVTQPTMKTVYMCAGQQTSSGSACCNVLVSAYNKNNNKTFHSTGYDASQNACPMADTSGNFAGFAASPQKVTKLVCSDGSDPVGGVCPDTCTNGQSTDDISGEGGTWTMAAGIIRGSTSCVGGCVVSGQNDGNSCITANGETVCQTFFKGGKQTGQSCTNNPDASKSSAPTCGPGETMGTVNGNQTCLKSGSSVPTPGPSTVKTSTQVSQPVTTTNSDGSTSTATTTTTTKTSPYGTSTTTETTTVTTTSDGKSTTSKATQTSGTVDPPVSQTSNGSQQPNQEQKDLCQTHPELNICHNSSVSGTCGEITCSGDAITCAIARETAAKRCEDKAASDAIKDSPEYKLGKDVMGGADPMSGILPNKDNAMQLNLPTALDTSGFLGGGSCFADKTFSVQGHQFTLPFSAACAYLVAFRYALMIAAMLISFRMLSGTILRE